MGLKMGGFVCDNCSCFSPFSGAKNGSEFRRNGGWVYYNIIPLNKDWFKWVSGKTECYCMDCDRLIKLNKIVTKLKKHD